MNTATTVSPSSTRQPKLTRAVIRQLGGRESLHDIATHSADAGWPGFTYYRDTCEFYKRNKKDIIARANQDSDEFGCDMLEMIAGFGCLKDMKLKPFEVAQAIEGRGDNDNVDLVHNALAWYALEEVAREMCPDC